MSAPAYQLRDLRWPLGPGFALHVDALDIPRGLTTTLLGPSASGKSTLLSLLGRVESGYFPEAAAPPTGQLVYHPPSGEPVDLLALDEQELLRARLRGDQIGVVFQREGLFVDRDARDNVAWPLSARGVPLERARARADELLARTGLTPDRRVATLSGGERKRLALARALALDPPTLLLDEPFTGLDPSALRGLRDLVDSLRREHPRTIVLVTHQPGDIEQLAEHVVLLRQGRVEAAGPLDAVADPLARYLAASRTADGASP
ncbi:MAG: ATP-binding cassette domain-containing protein [Deltaproteobacteria bacterium]|nr:ATP-binding cassette domain-containing protein [Deltaproteobacteria bacterium]MCB9786270.1 ATP-binding cassette domain-containing protein [Deltaproteobacteria bacterium]